MEPSNPNVVVSPVCSPECLKGLDEADEDRLQLLSSIVQRVRSRRSSKALKILSHVNSPMSDHDASVANGTFDTLLAQSEHPHPSADALAPMPTPGPAVSPAPDVVPGASVASFKMDENDMVVDANNNEGEEEESVGANDGQPSQAYDRKQKSLALLCQKYV